MTKEYRYSNAVSLLGAVRVIFVGLISSVIGGGAYAYALAYIPFVYVRLLLTIGWSLGLGWLVANQGMKGNVRSPLLLATVAVMCALVALYFEYAVYVVALVKDGLDWTDFLPETVLARNTALLEQGSWSYGQTGEPVRGDDLKPIWIIEAIIIILFSGVGAHMFAAEKVFCEHCKRWYEGRLGEQYLSTGDDSALWDDVRNGDLSKLTQLEQFDGPEFPCLRVDVYRCPSCQDSNYYSLVKLYGRHKKEYIVKMVWIAEQDLPFVLNEQSSGED